MIIYIAGKISGDEHCREKFSAKEKELTEDGHTVLNPAVYPGGLKNVDYMRMCFSMMEAADMVIFLEDYIESKGAQLEMEWCDYVGKTYLIDDEEGIL